MEASRRYFVGGNWKSNGRVQQVKDLIVNVINESAFDPSKVDVVVSPIMLHIPLAKVMLKDGVQVAAQNVSRYPEGAYTGEVAASALVDFGIHWVIIGHSERRTLFGECDETVAKKVAQAQEKGMKIILCIGESDA